MPTLPSAFPPPYDPAAAVDAPNAPIDLQIPTGVCIVGGGAAGLACAVKLGQLLADDPESLERLGEVPIVVIEKGKADVAHGLAAAVEAIGFEYGYFRMSGTDGTFYLLAFVAKADSATF